MLNKIVGKYLLFFLNCFSLILLINCSDSSDKANIQEFVNKTKALKMQEVEPLPEKKQNISVRYLGGERRSPFITSDEYIRSKVATKDAIVAPDLSRPKKILENYSLDDLKMVGSIKKADGSNWALITDNKGVVYKVTIGSHMGNNYGEVIKVDEKNIEIKEAVSNGYGGWQETTVIMKLKE